MIKKEGYIYKEGGAITTWKKRFLVLEEDRAVYYKKDTKKDRQGDITYSEIMDIKQVKEYKGRKNIFSVATSGNEKRIFYIQTSDDISCKSWIEAIQTNVNLRKDKARRLTDTTKSEKEKDDKTQSRSKSVTGENPVSSFQAKILTPPSISNTNSHTNSTSSPNPTSNSTQLKSPNLQPNKSPNKKKVTIDDYERLQPIGRGSFGRVFLVLGKNNGQYYAMKVLKKKQIVATNEVQHTLAERNVLATLQSPFLPKLYYTFQNEKRLYFIMDFINGGELFYHLQNEGKFDEERTRFYAAQIVSVLMFLHEQGIIYRDLKPENLLLSKEGNIVLIDFSLAKEGLRGTEALTSTFVGTPEYYAPEVLNNKKYTKAVDWWSCGTLIYEMLNGYPPFFSENQQDMYAAIIRAELVIPENFSPEAGDLVKQFLQRDPADRLQDPEKIKTHPWFQSVDWEKVKKLEIKPPFVPDVNGAGDTSNIDSGFLEEDLEDSESEEFFADVVVKDDEFKEFDFDFNLS